MRTFARPTQAVSARSRRLHPIARGVVASIALTCTAVVTAGGSATAAGVASTAAPVRVASYPNPGPDPFCVHTCGPFTFDLVSSVVLPPDLADRIRAELAPGLQLRHDAQSTTDPVAAGRWRVASTSRLSQAETLFGDGIVTAGAATTLPLCVPRSGRAPDRGAFELQLADGLSGLGRAHRERNPARAASLQLTAEGSLDAAAAIAAPCYA